MQGIYAHAHSRAIATWAGVCAAMGHVIDVLFTVAILLKTPIAHFLAVAAAIALYSSLFGLVFAFLRSTVEEGLTTKICVLPVVSRLPFCATPIQSSLPHTNPVSAHADFPNLVRLQSTALDELLDHSASGADLAVNLKQAELAVSDLVTLVRASNLTAKDVLADALFGFVGDAKVAGRGLQRLASKVHSVADT